MSIDDPKQFLQDNTDYNRVPEVQNIEEIFHSPTSASLIQENKTVNPQTNMAEEDGFQYVAGWIAKKFKNEFPELGSITKANEEHKYTLPSWLDHLSFGGLTTPSDEWMQVVKLIETEFNTYNEKQQLNDRPNISKILTDKIMKKQTAFPEKIIKAYILQRIFIRIKHLNLKIKEVQFNKLIKRKNYNTDIEGYKNSKKMKKIIT